jgi:hypothetical protein
MNDRGEYAQRLRQDFARVRGVLLAGGAVPDRRRPDGSAVTNYFPRSGSGGRTQAFAVLPLRRTGLSPDFLLGMKQNAHYTCVLEELVGHADFEVVAIIRHPLATIRSWRSANLPISDGRLPAAERFWPELARLADDSQDVLLRQVHIYRMFCERYCALGERVRLLRYEDIVRDPSILGVMSGRRYARQVALDNGNNASGDAAEDATIRAYLREHCPIAYELYPDLAAATA